MTDQTERGAPNPNARREHLAERLRQIAESQRMDFDSPDVASTLDEAADALDATPAIDPDDDLDDIANDAATNDGRAIVWAINELTRALKAATS